MMTNCNLLLQSIGDAIMMLDKEGYIKYSNTAASAITGYTSAELINRPFTILYADSNDTIRSEYELQTSLKKGKFISEGWKSKKNEGNYWGEMILMPVYDEQNTLAGFSCQLRDTSERNLAEISLRKSEERYRLMVEGVKEYTIFMLDPKGYILTWNDGGQRIQGYKTHEIIGKHFSIFYTAEDLENKKPANELYIATNTGRYEEEGWRVRKNGSLFWAYVVITALFNEQNILIGFSKVTRDLTDKKQAEENLRQSEERYRMLVEQVTDYGIFMLDEKGRIISWNEGARRIKGYNADEIIGKYFSIFYPEEDILTGKPAHELKVATKEGKYEEEGWRLRKDGSLFWANVVITAVYNNAGVLVGFSKVTRDLTERKASERVLRESYDSYKKLAGELQKINTELSYANDELEQFTSIVSHDLQEPIRTIKSFLQLIEMKLAESGSPELDVYIKKSIYAANRMKELIHNLLHYSQLSRGEMVQQEVKVDEIFNEALQNLKTSLDLSRAQVTIENDCGIIIGDRIQLVQLVQNLLSNALKFTTSENPEVKIKCTREDGQVKFSVTDNGIGIAESDLQKVFDIFRRLHTKKQYEGTGIGLAICKKIVDRHRGKIWPESKPGLGTTFYFTINQEVTESQPVS